VSRALDTWSPGLVLRRRRPAVSLRLDRRVLVVQVALALGLIGALTVEIVVGGNSLGLGDVVAVLTGHGDPGATFIVQDIRLPRALTGLMTGFAFGVAGAILQAVTRNPLGSPDVLGFTSGASAGGVLVILLFGGTTLTVAFGAVAGGLLTATLVCGLAYRNGLHGDRLVLVGIATAYALAAATAFLLSRASREEAMGASIWLFGSLNGRGWEHVRPVAIALVVLLPLVVYTLRGLRALELDDDTAHTLGVRTERTRLAVVALSTGLAAVAVASVGPVGFVALAAPQIARRLTRASGPGLLAAGLMGAIVLLLSDVAAQLVFTDRMLPVGVVTGVLGGAYLCWLLSRHWQRG
jgi:iron complex transport system permease protein